MKNIRQTNDTPVLIGRCFSAAALSCPDDSKETDFYRDCLYALFLEDYYFQSLPDEEQDCLNRLACFDEKLQQISHFRRGLKKSPLPLKDRDIIEMQLIGLRECVLGDAATFLDGVITEQGWIFNTLGEETEDSVFYILDRLDPVNYRSLLEKCVTAARAGEPDTRTTNQIEIWEGNLKSFSPTHCPAPFGLMRADIPSGIPFTPVVH